MRVVILILVVVVIAPTGWNQYPWSRWDALTFIPVSAECTIPVGFMRDEHEVRSRSASRWFPAAWTMVVPTTFVVGFLADGPRRWAEPKNVGSARISRQSSAWTIGLSAKRYSLLTTPWTKYKARKSKIEAQRPNSEARSPYLLREACTNHVDKILDIFDPPPYVDIFTW